MKRAVSFADGEAVGADTDEELRVVAGDANQDRLILRAKAKENGCPKSDYNPPMSGRYTI